MVTARAVGGNTATPSSVQPFKTQIKERELEANQWLRCVKLRKKLVTMASIILIEEKLISSEVFFILFLLLFLFYQVTNFSLLSMEFNKVLQISLKKNNHKEIYSIKLFFRRRKTRCLALSPFKHLCNVGVI